MAGMKPAYKTLCLLAILIAPLSGPARAASAPDSGLDSALAMALEQAWAAHPQAGALQARTDAAHAELDIAAALTPAPAELSLGHLNDRLGSNRGNQEWEIELAAPLWLPGQKAGQAAVAAGALDLVAARRAALRLELAGELRAAWWALAAARQAEALAQRRLDSARELEADVMRRYQAGELARLDANLARGETLLAQAASLQSATALRQAERDWRGLTRMPPPAHLAAETTPPAAESDLHPGLAALASVARSTQAQLQLARASRRDAPHLALGVQRERGDRDEAYGHAVGLKLSIPFASAPRQRRDNAVARAELAEAEVEQARASVRLTLELEHARLQQATTQQLWEMAQERQALSADNLQLAETSFRLGESGLSALLRARSVAFEAEAALNAAEVARGQAISQLRHAMGLLP
jgi:outer membrane protein, heavy metal efflux system